METRYFGGSGFKVPVLGLGVGTFGGKGPLFSAWGRIDAAQAKRMIDRSLDAGVNLFDSADVYSDGAADEILGAALAGRRQRAIISSKISLRFGDGPNDVGASRHHLIAATEATLRRLQTDYLDILTLHHFDAMTPVEVVVDTLDELVRAGKVRLLGASNHSGWQLMKSLAVADRRARARFVSHQAYYSLIGRDYEWELMPLAVDQGLGTMVWSPLGWGRLTGKLRRDRPLPAESRLRQTEQFAPPVEQTCLFRVLDALHALEEETKKTVPQLAINWLLQRPTVSTVLIGARDEAQLQQNLLATGWSLSAEQMQRLDRASAVSPPYPYYPYWNGQFAERTPPPVPVAR